MYNQPPPPMNPYAPPRKSRRAALWVALAAFAVIAVVGVVTTIVFINQDSDKDAKSSEAHQPASLQTLAKIQLYRTIISTKISQSDVPVRFDLASRIVTSSGEAEEFIRTAEHVKADMDIARAFFAKFKPFNNTLKDDPQSYRDFQAFVDTAGKELNRLGSLSDDFEKGKEWLPSIAQYVSPSSHPLIAAFNPHITIDFSQGSTFGLPPAEAKSMAEESEKEQSAVLAELKKFKPTTDYMKFLKTQLTDVFESQVEAASTFAKGSGDLQVLLDYQTAMLEVKLDTEKLSDKNKEVFPADVQQDFDKASIDLVGSISKYTESAFHADEFKRSKEMLKQLELIKDELDTESYKKHKHFLELSSTPEGFEKLKEELEIQIPEQSPQVIPGG